MKQEDRKKFIEIMYALSENFSGQVTPDGLKVRFMMLKKYSIEQIEKAAFRIMSSRVYTKMPTVAEFVGHIEGQTDDRAEMEAQHVIKQIRTVGSYGSPRFEDPVTADLFKSRFSWGTLCSYTEKEIDWFVKRFTEAYLTYERVEHTKKIEIPHEAVDLKLIVGGIGKRF